MPPCRDCTTEAACESVCAKSQNAPKPKGWIALTDDDRDAAFNTMPNLLDGFMKLWGWLHFAKAIEQKVMEKNTHLIGSPCLPGSTCKNGDCPAGECANESNGICTVCGEVNVMCECAQKIAHSKSEYKRRVAMGDTNVAPPHGVPGTFICRKPAIGPACETQCEKCAADTLGVEGRKP